MPKPDSILNLYYKFWTNFIECFSPHNLPWHGLAIILTWLLVRSGFDWRYFQAVHNSPLYPVMISAAAVGFLVPILFPLALLLWGRVRQNPKAVNLALALGQAAIMGWLISSVYKAVTGRAHPTLKFDQLTDITHIFKFGFFRNGIFFGWPSSHTTVAFAMALAFFVLVRHKTGRVLALVYAFYIGLGVAGTIHWFSDFVAGAIIGSIIGIVVGRSFLARISVVKSSN